MFHLSAQAAALIAAYGYPAIFLVGAFEGEVALILGGITANQGLLSLPLVIALAFCGGVIADLTWFSIGRLRAGKPVFPWARFERLMKRFEAFIERRPKRVSFWLRFMFGARHVVPFSLGASKVSTRTFLPLYLAGAAIWAVSVGLLGYFAGAALEAAILSFHRYRFAAILLAVGLGWLVHAMFSRTRMAVERRARIEEKARRGE